MKHLKKIVTATALAVAILAGFRLAEFRSPKETPKVALLTPAPAVSLAVAKEDPNPTARLAQPPEKPVAPIRRMPPSEAGFVLHADGSCDTWGPAYKIEIKKWLAEHSKELPMKISNYEIEHAQRAYNKLYEDKAKLEKSIAILDVSDPGKLNIIIPSYPLYKDDLLNHFTQELTRLMGTDRALILADFLEKPILYNNHGLGSGQQRISVKKVDLDNPGPLAYVKNFAPGEYYEVIHHNYVFDKNGSEIGDPQGGMNGIVSSMTLTDLEPVAANKLLSSNP